MSFEDSFKLLDNGSGKKACILNGTRFGLSSLGKLALQLFDHFHVYPIERGSRQWNTLTWKQE
jgi:hypothetical protein